MGDDGHYLYVDEGYRVEDRWCSTPRPQTDSYVVEDFSWRGRCRSFCSGLVSVNRRVFCLETFLLPVLFVLQNWLSCRSIFRAVCVRVWLVVFNMDRFL